MFGKKFLDSGYLLTTQIGTPLTPDRVYNIYHNFMKEKSGLRYLRMHKIRHTYASLAISNNTDIKTVQEILGHASASITLNVYSHAYNEKKKSYAQKLDATLYKARN